MEKSKSPFLFEFAKNTSPIMKGDGITMKKYEVYVTKSMVDYFETKLAEHGVIIVSRESIEDKLYYYVLKAEDGIIDPEFEMEGA